MNEKGPGGIRALTVRPWTASMLRRIEGNGQQDLPGLVHHFKLPAAPIDLVGFAVLPQFMNGLERLVMGCLYVRHLDARLIQDTFMRMYKMKVAMHARQP